MTDALEQRLRAKLADEGRRYQDIRLTPDEVGEIIAELARLNKIYIMAIEGRATFRTALVEARGRINQLFACVCNFADPTYWSEDMRWTGKRNPIEYAQWTIDNPTPEILANVTPPSNREPAETGAVLASVGDSSPGRFESCTSSESEKSAPMPVIAEAEREMPHDLRTEDLDGWLAAAKF